MGVSTCQVNARGTAAKVQAEPTLETLSHLYLPPEDLECLGLVPGRLRLRRAWPRGTHRLGLEYTAPAGRTVVGQWLADAGRLERVARATARTHPARPAPVTLVREAGVLLQGGGADRRLPGLAALLARPGATLIVHRPERRAVVRLVAGTHTCYAKVVRPERVAALAATGRAVRDPEGEAFATPRLLATYPALGVLLWTALPGVSLYALLDSERLVPAAFAAGRALRALHTISPPPATTAHGPRAEIDTLRQWLVWVKRWTPWLAGALVTAAPPVFETLTAGKSPPVLLHRDFYDKQVFVDTADRVGLLDFDTLAVGEAALDLANVLVHLELRSLQGRCSPERAAVAAAALLDGYRPEREVWARIPPYADATRLRLACVYAFRPPQASLVPALLARLGHSVMGTF